MTVPLSEFLHALSGPLPAEAGTVVERWRPGEQLMLIAGDLRSAAGGKTFENLNPATEVVMGVAPDGDESDMDQAIAAARRAFDETSWAGVPTFRAHCLGQLRDGLTDAADEMRATIVSELGAPVLTTYGLQVSEPIEKMQLFVDLAGAYPVETLLPDVEALGERTERRIRREPFGVVAAVTPWNYPLELIIAKVCAALAAGNTVVLKPSPETPWTATVFARIVAEKTDMPPGVLNIVTAKSPETSIQLVTDPRVDMVSFTGSTQTGKAVMSAASATIKKTVLELGGKSAAIVLDDASFDDVVPMAASAALLNTGQGCINSTRLLVPFSKMEEAAKLARLTYEGLTFGDPSDPETLLGPVISKQQQDRILHYIEVGRDEGASLVAGGNRGTVNGKGFFVEPTVFVDVQPEATIAQEEIFGPVLALIGYEDDDDAVRIANSTAYGLAGMVFSASRERALNVARRVRTGMIGVNGASFIHADTPFGGYGQSGLGREWGQGGVEEFLEIKTLCAPAEK